VIFRNLDLLREDPAGFLVLILMVSVALLIAITIHEFSHAWTASFFGDDTAKRQGRVSLNPLVHLDPIGTLMLLFVGFGWGKPVPVNSLRLRRERDMALVAFAGPLSNLVFAALLFLPFRFGNMAPPDVLVYVLFFSIVLALFNLIPIPPLDGFNVAMGFVPDRLLGRAYKFAIYGPIVLVMILGADMFLNLGILSRLLFPAVNFVAWLLTGQRFML